MNAWKVGYRIAVCGLGFAVSLGGSGLPARAAAQTAEAVAPNAANYPLPRRYPDQDAAGVARHLSAARRIAGNDLFGEMAWRCIVSPLFPDRVAGVQYNGRITPVRVFDKLYSIGQNAVAAYALDTSQGIILIDALDNADEAKNILIPDLKAVGLDPARIRYLVITHGHGDHYGGARYLQDTYHIRVVASTIDWKMILTPQTSGPFAGLVPPRRDMAVNDGDTLTLGDTTIKFYVTPGHTPGTLSMIFNVTDQGRRHVVGFYGGTGGGHDIPTIETQIASLQRWERITAQAGVDALVTNHPSHDQGIVRQELLTYREPGDSNPFVFGADRYQRYFRMLDECSKVQLARLGVKDEGQ